MPVRRPRTANDVSTYHVTSAAGATATRRSRTALSPSMTVTSDNGISKNEQTHHLDVIVGYLRGRVLCFTMASPRMTCHWMSAHPTIIAVISAVDATANRWTWASVLVAARILYQLLPRLLARAEVTEKISSKVDVCEKAKHHAEVF